jgi:hypothetical protein
MSLASTQQITPSSLSRLQKAPSSQKIDQLQLVMACGGMRYGNGNVQIFPPPLWSLSSVGGAGAEEKNSSFL